jgi:hypothetical protein
MEVKVLYTEYYKTLKKEIDKNTRRGKVLSCISIGRTIVIKGVLL